MSTTAKKIIIVFIVFCVAGVLAFSAGLLPIPSPFSKGGDSSRSLPSSDSSSQAEKSSTTDDSLNASDFLPRGTQSNTSVTSPSGEIGAAGGIVRGAGDGLTDFSAEKGKTSEGNLGHDESSTDGQAGGVNDAVPANHETVVPSTEIPALVEPPTYRGESNATGKDGKIVRMTVDAGQDSGLDNRQGSSTILGTTSFSDGVSIPSSQDTVIPFTLIQSIARDLVNGYWPKGTHVMATSGGVITTTSAFLNSRYGTKLSGKYNAYTEAGQARQGLLDYILMPSMVDGLYRLYAERFIRLVNQAAQERLYTHQETHQETAQPLKNSEIAEMYGLYAQSLKSNAGCIRGFISSGEIRLATQKFIRAEHEATEANMTYQEHSLDAENANSVVPRKIEQQYRVKVAERETARQNLAASFRRFTDTRNMDTSDLVFLAKWLNRRSMAHNDGLSALARTLDNLAARMDREQQRYLNQ